MSNGLIKLLAKTFTEEQPKPLPFIFPVQSKKRSRTMKTKLQFVFVKEVNPVEFTNWGALMCPCCGSNRVHQITRDVLSKGKWGSLSFKVVEPSALGAHELRMPILCELCHGPEISFKTGKPVRPDNPPAFEIVVTQKPGKPVATEAVYYYEDGCEEAK
jgi:hypothetical protein